MVVLENWIRHWPWIAAALVVLAVFAAMAVYIQRLRSRLKISESKYKEMIRKLEESTKVLHHRSSIDGLTGIPNRLVFDETLVREWARAKRMGVALSVLMVDIDLFKKHNDAHGHQAGDMCLRQVALTLDQTAKRPADLVTRYGGEEFGVILPQTNVEGALTVAENMRAAIARLKLPHVNSVTGHDVTISVGVASTIPASGGSPQALVAAADVALYQAKAVGRNQVILEQQATRA